MKRTRYISLIIALLSVFNITAQQQQRQYALYNYRNDGDFNAWLNIDVDSITYSNIGVDSIEYDNIVTQEVWTPDSCYRIPLEVIDSIGFRAPKPVMQEGIFYLRDYHATLTNSIDSLTLYFDNSILNDSLPFIGQTILCATKMTPYEDGFAGKVVEIKTTSEGIAVICEEAEIGDIFKQLVLVGKVMSEQEEGEAKDSRKRAFSSDPWINLEDIGVKQKEIEPLSFDLFDGLIEVISPRPRLTCTYYVYVSEVYYEIYVNVDLQHRDLTYKLTFSTDQLKDLEEYGSFFKALATDNIDEWLNEKINKSIKKYLEEQKYEDKIAEEKLAQKIWKTKKWDIPIIEDGVLNLTLTIAPLFKTKGSITATTEFKTDAMQSMSIKVKGITPIAKSSSKIDYARASFHQDPIKSAKLDIEAEGSVTLGFTALLNANVVHRKVLYAGIGGEFGVDITGILNVTAIDTEQPDMNMYDMLKDTKLKISEYGKWYLEAGVSPLDIFHLSGPKWDIFSPFEQIYYLMPHFTEPQMPKFGKRSWLSKDPLSFYTFPSKDVFIPCRIGMRITDEEGNFKKQYIIDNEKYVWEKDWLNRFVKIDVSDLPKGASYRCYPVMSFLNGTIFNAGPHHDFYVPLPVVASPSELKLAVGTSAEVQFFGGWDTFAVVMEKGEDVASIIQDGEPRHITVYGKKVGTASLKIEDRRTGQVVHVPITIKESMTLVSSIELDETSLRLQEGDTHSFIATILPEDADNKAVTWESSDEDVATVSNDGIVTAVAKGSCTITCSATDGSGKYAECLVTVTDAGGTDLIICPDDHHPHIIDLGLPSGTKWACCNVGATTPEGCGGYYAWGEKREKSVYNWDEYFDSECEKYHNGGQTELLPEDDTATANMGAPWRMPTITQIQELCDNCSQQWTQRNGVNGILVTSNHNEGQIFLPAAGNHWNDELNDAGSGGYYWSSSLLPVEIDYFAYRLYFDSSGWNSYKDNGRILGLTVRAVRVQNTTQRVTSITLGETSISLVAGATHTLTATIQPENATNKTLEWKSSDESVATVNASGLVTAVNKGNCVITCSATDGSGVKAECKVNVTEAGGTAYLTCPDDNHPHIIDLGLPNLTMWACCNVGAHAPEEYGGYYAWGETWEKNIYTMNNYSYCTDLNYGYCSYIGSNIAGTGYDAATVNMRAPWRMPSSAQQQELINNCKCQWTQKNGVDGILVTGPNGGQIFLPAAGEKSARGFHDGVGSYWSSSQYWDDKWYQSYPWAYKLNFDSNNWGSDFRDRSVGLPVRAVCVLSTPTLVTDITLSETSLCLQPNEIHNLTATIKPDNATNRTVTWSSSDEGVATVDQTGKVTITAIDAGHSCTITCSATDFSGVTAKCGVTVVTDGSSQLICPDDHHPHEINLGLPSGTKWCCCNVGATTPESYGGYYAWGETSEKDDYHWDTYKYRYTDIGSEIAFTKYDAAKVNMGAPWRMPTVIQVQELYDNCSQQWTQRNGVNGILVTSNLNNGQIFLPAAGYRYRGERDAGRGGLYWSSSLNSEYSSCSYYLYFDSDDWYWDEDWGYQCDGRSVRAVCP